MESSIKNPTIFEINTWVWLEELSRSLRKKVTMATVPKKEWDKLALLNLDVVWMLGVWERSPKGIKIARESLVMQNEYREALPDLRPEDIAGSPFSVHRYRVDAHLGGDEALAIAREALKARGIRLMLDYVPNHVALDHPWVSEHPEYLMRGKTDDLHQMPGVFVEIDGQIFAHGQDLYFPAWQDTLQVNPFHPRFRQAAIETLLHIAGLCDYVRCDMPMLLVNRICRQIWGERPGPPLAREFWSEVIAGVKRRFPHLVLLAEAYWDMEWELQQMGFDICYDKKFYDRLLHGNAEDVEDHLVANSEWHYRRVRFIENHDELRAAKVFCPEKQRAAAVAFSTLPGARLFHQGQFEGFRIRLPVQLGRRQAEPVDNDLYMFYQRLLSEISAEAYKEGIWQSCHCVGWPGNEGWRRLIGWCWSHGGERRLVAINFSDQEAEGRIRIPWPDLAGCDWRLSDHLNGDCYIRQGREIGTVGLYVKLPPYGTHVFHCERHEHGR